MKGRYRLLLCDTSGCEHFGEAAFRQEMILPNFQIYLTVECAVNLGFPITLPGGGCSFKPALTRISACLICNVPGLVTIGTV